MSNGFDDKFDMENLGSDEPLIPGDLIDDFDDGEAVTEISDEMLDFEDASDGAGDELHDENMFNWNAGIVTEGNTEAPVSRRQRRQNSGNQNSKGLIAGIIAGAVVVVAVICVIIGLASRGHDGGSKSNETAEATGTPAVTETANAEENASATETTEADETAEAAETPAAETAAAPTETAAAAAETVYFPETSTNLAEFDTAYVKDGNSLQADADAVAAAEQLIDAANAEGLPLKVEKAWYDTESDAADVKEHATGYALDFTESNETRNDFVPDADGTMDETLTWMLQHAAEYGFLLSLKSDNYGYLTYHYVYVGTQKAQEVEKNIYTISPEDYVYYDDYLAQH